MIVIVFKEYIELYGLYEIVDVFIKGIWIEVGDMFFFSEYV